MRWILLTIALAIPGFAGAQTSPAEQARAAIDTLNAAVDGLEAAEGARDRVRALTDTIGGLEEGLAALRDGLRRAELQANALAARLQAQESDTAALLAVLMYIGDGRKPAVMVHPGGPKGAVRSGMLLAHVTTEIDARTQELRSDIENLAALQSVQLEAEAQLAAGLVAVQDARTALNNAIAERTAPPKRFVNDPVREAILIASAASLAQFADGLDRISVDEIAPAADDLEGEKGALALPVRGDVIRKAGEPDAAGVVRPGIIVATQHDALVTTPTSATIRYAGPLLELGNVVILEPQADVLFVFAGLGTLYGAAGDVIAAGTPLGLMHSFGRKNAALPSTDGDQTGAGGPERLYIEVRQDDVPEDPSLWFQTDNDG